jgi:tetratricopeptide (TPR) repeat protein
LGILYENFNSMQSKGGTMRTSGAFFKILALCAGLCVSFVIPQALFAQANTGVELFNAGAYEKAELKLRETLKAKPGDTTQRYYLGLTLLNRGKYPEGLKELETVKSEQEKASQWSRPAVPNVYQIDIALAQAYLTLKQFDKAWPKLESAGIESPGSAEVFLYRGVYYYKQKENAKAIVELEKAIRLDPKNAYAYYYVGHAYYDSGEPAKMVEAFKIFLQLAPGAPEAAEAKRLVDANC